MGLDMYLASVLNPDDKTAFDAAVAATEEAVARFQRSGDRADLIAALNIYYDVLRATGGYYREPYNPLGLFPLLGLSWEKFHGEKEVGPTSHPQRVHSVVRVCLLLPLGGTTPDKALLGKFTASTRQQSRIVNMNIRMGIRQVNK